MLDSEVLIYAPFKEENLEKKEIDWLNTFQSILELSLQQISKHKIQIVSTFSNKDLIKDKVKVLIPVLVNKEFENIDESDLRGKKLIQVNRTPEVETILSKDALIINIYDEVRNKSIDLSGTLHELKNEIWLKFLDIAYEIREVVSAKKVQRKVKGNIYIAETSTDQNINRETIIRELEHLNYKILPEKHFPKDMLSFSELVQENLRECFLSIHIIGNYYAPLLENLDISSIELQNDLFHETAAELNAKNQILKRLVWIPPDIKPKSEKQKLYIESFKRNIELLKNTEIIQTPIEIFKSILNDKAEEYLEVKNEKKEVDHSKQSIYIITNDSSGDQYKIIKDKISKSNLQILEAGVNKDKIDLIQNHYYNLINCDAVLIDYSIENKQWLSSKLSDIVKSPGFGRKKDFMAKAILVNTKEMPQINIGINNLELINIKKEDINKRLASFIEKINQK